MGSVSVQIVISGYYGFRNSGDEAVLKSILNSLADQEQTAGIKIVPVVLSNDPEWTARMYGVRSVHRMKLGEIRALMKESDGLISGGGSLLQDATGPLTIPYYLGIIHIAQWARKPVFIYAQGVGPVEKGVFFKWIRNVFRKSAYVSVRDQESAALLGRMGLDSNRITVVADPVMGLPLPDHEAFGAAPSAVSMQNSPLKVAETGHPDAENDMIPLAVDSNTVNPNVHVEADANAVPLIGISLRFWDKQRRELNGIADALQQLARQRPVHLRFLPFHLPEDEQASAYVIQRIGDIHTSGSTISTAEQIVDPQQMLAEVSRCDLVLGMRLHSLIYAASQHVPLLGISYDPKIDQFLNRLAIQPSGTSEEVQPDRLLNDMLHVLDTAVEWKQDKAAYIAALKQDAAQPAKFIAHYFLGQR
ncbi:polysaccharide pyruvyl transferase CsaB [Paenibacillus wenxiniae]|uniref:Polysaccharide pyruvyl transferase CsaB n=1 Tax=Paenibacillus wenxiniae TaxID=1636843 RepID=A0ABW4RP10_9BACL